MKIRVSNNFKLSLVIYISVFGILVLSIMPLDLKKYYFKVFFFRSDQILHLIIYFYLSLLFFLRYKYFSLNSAFLLIIFGFIIELIQIVFGREFSEHDILANSIGIISFFIADIFSNKFFIRRRWFYWRKIKCNFNDLTSIFVSFLVSLYFDENLNQNR